MHIEKGLAATIVAAFALVVTANAEPITLRVAHAFPSRDSLFRQPIAEQFMQQHPDIRIELEANATDCPALLQQMLRASITNDLPDVVASLCYPDMAVLAERGALVALDQFIANDASWPDVGVEPGAMATTQWQGKTVAVPESVSTSIVYYNMTALRQSNMDLTVLPSTWPEIIALANEIEQANDEIIPIFFEYFPDSYNWSFNGLVYSHGGDVFTPDGEIAFDGEAGMKALRLLRQFGEAGMVDMTSEQARQAFASGQIGIYVASNSRLGQLTANAGKHLEIRTAPYPQSAPDGKMQSGGGGIAITTKDPARQKAAWEYLKFAVSPAAQAVMVSTTGLTPVNTKAVESKEYLADFYEERPNYLTAIQQLPRIKSMNLYPGENGRKITTVIRDHLQSVVTLKRTPEEVMPDMVRDVTALLPE